MTTIERETDPAAISFLLIEIMSVLKFGQVKDRYRLRMTATRVGGVAAMVPSIQGRLQTM